MADKTMIPLHAILDKCLGFSIRDLVLKTPEDHEKFKQMLQDKIDEIRAERARTQKKE
jgi:hypothetical protein